MSAITRVRRARALLLTTVAGASLLWAAAAVVVPLGLAALADLLVPLPVAVRRVAVPLALATAVAALLVVLWRGRHARALGRVALFLEERLPELHFALATAVQPAGAPSEAGALALERAVARVDARGALRTPVARALGVPAAALALGLAALVLVPAGTLERILHPRAGGVLLRRPPATTPIGNRLVPVAVRVEPPRYARRAASVTDDPSAVAALVGSRIEVRGRGAAAGLADRLGATVGAGSGGARRPLSVRAVGDTWGVQLAMPADPAVVRLTDRSYDRLLVLRPVPDEPPTVSLDSPRADTLLMTPKGRLALDAQVEDDIGLARAEFELMYTSGSGERFETKVTTLGRVALGGRRTHRLRTTIVLDTMKLQPGDVLHLRALAWDENDVTGPGKGESETRTIRIHDPRQVSDVKLTPAKSAALDTTILTQRMLNMRAETLLVVRSRIQPEEYTTRSLRLGIQQGALRGKVESIIFELENVEGVGFVGNTPSSLILREAAEEMRVAERELSIAQVPVALVHMKNALKLLEKIRNANRYWIRGLLTTTPIDVNRVRLTGTDAARVGAREARERPDDARKALLERLDRAVLLLDGDAAAGRDSLQLVFAAALAQARDVAEPLGEAVEMLQRGADPTRLLVSARRRLERRVEREGTLSTWFGTR
jgi:hypothetical protein